MFHRVVWHLAAQGKTLAEIVTLLRQHPNGIAAKYLKPKDRLDKEAKRSFKKYIANNPPALIAKWNENHAHVLAGGKERGAAGVQDRRGLHRFQAAVVGLVSRVERRAQDNDRQRREGQAR